MASYQQQFKKSLTREEYILHKDDYLKNCLLIGTNQIVVIGLMNPLDTLLQIIKEFFPSETCS